MLLLLAAVSPIVVTGVFRAWEPPEIIPWWGAVTPSESPRWVAHRSQSFPRTSPVRSTLVPAWLVSVQSVVLPTSTMILAPPIFRCCSPLPAALPWTVRSAWVFHGYSGLNCKMKLEQGNTFGDNCFNMWALLNATVTSELFEGQCNSKKTSSQRQGPCQSQVKVVQMAVFILIKLSTTSLKLPVLVCYRPWFCVFIEDTKRIHN